MQFTTMIREKPDSTETLVSTPSAVFSVCNEMTGFSQEAFVVLCLDSKNRLMQDGKILITLGIVDASLAHPREVFRAAIKMNSTSIILVHNHPSGDSSPSAEDIKITRQLIEAGKILDIGVLDHVIIGKEPYSIRESGLIKF